MSEKENPDRVKLLPHQQKAVEQLKSGNILGGGVGTGKTHTSLYFVQKNYPELDILVFTTARKRDDFDWQETAAEFGIGNERTDEVTQKITVDSWNNIQKYVGMTGVFMILDEQRLVGTGAWVKAFQKLAKENPWLLLSATPGDEWLDYAQVLIANGFYKNITEFRTKHCVFSYYANYPKLERYINTDILEKYLSKILVDMPYERHTTRHEEIVGVDYHKKTYFEVLKNRMNPWTGEPYQNVSGLFSGLRRVMYSDPSRLEVCRQILREKKNAIIFYNFDYELDILRKLPNTSEYNGHRHDPVPTERGGNWVYLVQYTAGKEAWNCTSTDTVIFYSANYSWKVHEQAMGRIDRLDTPYEDLYYYILACGGSVDRGVLEALKRKEDFNEKVFEKTLKNS